MTPQMTATLSHKFIAALEERRDGLYGTALAMIAEGAAANGGGSGGAAVAGGKVETFLQAVIREAFAAVEKDPSRDPWGAVEAAVAARGSAAAAVGPAAAMPADIWARLVATVQVEAARSAHTRAINPDSVLLSPDPLLAPRKKNTPDDADGFDLSPSSRFLLAAGIAVVVGMGLTIYLLTRPGPGPQPARRTETAATAGRPAATRAPATSAPAASAPVTTATAP